MPNQAALAMMRLLQIASPTLPVGAYSYSQGMERAVADGVIVDEPSASSWISDTMHFVLASFEVPCMLSMLQAVRNEDGAALHRFNAEFLASRETLELRAETLQMGRSLARLLGDLLPNLSPSRMLRPITSPSYPCAFACAASGFGLTSHESGVAYLWSWLENQTIAALKLVPLGQSAGQRILFDLGEAAAKLAESPISAEHWTNLAPGLALASTLHETQYSRLFRS